MEFLIDLVQGVLILFFIGVVWGLITNFSDIISLFKKKKPNYAGYINKVVIEILKDKYINDFISSIGKSDYDKDGKFSIKVSQIKFFDKIVNNIHKTYKKEDSLSLDLFSMYDINSDEEIEHAKHLLNGALLNMIIYNFKWSEIDDLLKKIIEVDNQLISLGDKSEYSIFKKLYSK